MGFIKKHYEKIILSVVLLALVGVLFLMLIVIMADKSKMEDAKRALIGGGKAVQLAPLDLSRQDEVVDRLKQTPSWDFTETNKLFNPVLWQRDKGKITKVENSKTVGPHAVTIVRIMPLYFVISLDSVDTNTVTPRYQVSVEHQAAAMAAMRRKVPHYVGVGESVKNTFKLDKIQGPAADPTELSVVLPDGTTNVVKKTEPFRRVEGYAADLRYDP